MRHYFVLLSCLFLLGCSKNSSQTKKTECQLTGLGYLDQMYPVTYEGTRIVKVRNTRLHYGNTGMLVRIEYPLENPTIRTDLFYNNEGKVHMEKKYVITGANNWLEDQTLTYTYTNGRLTGMTTDIPRTLPPLRFDHEVVWEGDNIRSIVIRSGTTVVCNNQFSYDMTKKNPMIALNYLYYSDNIDPSYKIPLYSSANLLIKEESNCSSTQTANITYGFNSSNMLEAIYINGSKLVSYRYECP